MEQFDLFEDSQEQHSVSVFNDRQMIALQDLDKKIPKVVKFLIADKFDDKFINSTNNIWKFYYSGQTEKLDFSIFSENETTLAKFFLIAFVQKNTPSFLSRKIYSFNFLINYLKNRNLHLNYENLKKLLIEIA
ncbi:site-specific integrase, partial [Acinetobacter baumannii]|nr:site-specific integrase [Acinetobacter baumannii]